MPRVATTRTIRRDTMPDAVGTPTLWLEADYGVHQQGGAVDFWQDRSGNANHGTQVTASKRPTYAESVAGINNKPAITLVAANSHHILLPNAFSGLTSAELFMILKSTSATGACNNFGNSAGTQELYPFSDTHIYENFASSSRNDTGVAITSIASFCVYNVQSAAGAFSSYLNNVLQFTTATNTVAWGANPAIGGSAGSGAAPSTFMDGQIALCLVYPAILSAANRGLLHLYINAKYGFTLP